MRPLSIPRHRLPLIQALVSPPMLSVGLGTRIHRQTPQQLRSTRVDAPACSPGALAAAHPTPRVSRCRQQGQVLPAIARSPNQVPPTQADAPTPCSAEGGTATRPSGIGAFNPTDRITRRTKLQSWFAPTQVTAVAAVTRRTSTAFAIRASTAFKLKPSFRLPMQAPTSLYGSTWPSPLRPSTDSSGTSVGVAVRIPTDAPPRDHRPIGPHASTTMLHHSAA